MKVAIVSEAMHKPPAKSFYPLFKLIEQRYDVTYFPDAKNIVGEFDVIWIHSIRKNRYIRSKTPIVFMPHGNMIFNLKTEKDFIKNNWKILKLKELVRRIGAYFKYIQLVRLEKKMLDSADVVMCYCQDNADIFIKQHPDIPKEKYFVIGYGCDYENFVC